MDESKLTADERRTLEAIEIYRAEHTTWNLERLRKVFADNPTVWRSGRSYIGNKEVDSLLVEWASKRRKKMEMSHGRTIIKGNFAAVEWRTTGENMDGSPIDMIGANIYELENGKIKYLAIYRRQ
jgi:SnoaL-like protein